MSNEIVRGMAAARRTKQGWRGAWWRQPQRRQRTARRSTPVIRAAGLLADSAHSTLLP